ncbi:MAG: hypothetical protein ACFE7R_09245 [Candidatus Hodarchaeota archaeon]
MTENESPREVASIVWTAITGGTKILVKTIAAYLNARWSVRNAKKSFRKKLQESGFPKETAEELADTYASAGQNMLSIRNLFRILREMPD